MLDNRSVLSSEEPSLVLGNTPKHFYDFKDDLINRIAVENQKAQSKHSQNLKFKDESKKIDFDGMSLNSDADSGQDNRDIIKIDLHADDVIARSISMRSEAGNSFTTQVYSVSQLENDETRHLILKTSSDVKIDISSLLATLAKNYYDSDFKPNIHSLKQDLESQIGN
jgi:hypothetical protein